MTENEYARIANVLERKYPVRSDLETPEAFLGRLHTWESIITGLGAVFTANDPHFSQHNFVTACYAGTVYHRVL